MASLSMFAHDFLGWLAHSQSSTKYSHPSSNDVLLVNKATSKENPDERVHFNSNREILTWAWLAVKKSYMDVVKAGSNGKQIDPTWSDPTTQRVFLERAIEPHDISSPMVYHGLQDSDERTIFSFVFRKQYAST